MAAPGSDKVLEHITRWVMRDDWAEEMSDVLADHIGPAALDFDLEADELADEIDDLERYDEDEPAWDWSAPETAARTIPESYKRGKAVGDLLLVDGDPLKGLKILQDKNRLLAIMKDGAFPKRPSRARPRDCRPRSKRLRVIDRLELAWITCDRSGGRRSP